MIRTGTCIVCGTKRLERTGGGIAPFIAHRCRIDAAATQVERAWCPSCDLLFFDQRLSEEEVRRLYLGYRDEAYILERDRFEPGYRERHPQYVDVQHEVQQNRIIDLKADVAAMGRPLGRVLDYGGGDGWLTREAFSGGNVLVYDLGNPAPPKGVFDLVVCAHVLEHVAFPVSFINEVKMFMKPQGLLYLEVPGPGRRPPATSVFDYMGSVMHEHVSFFSGRAVLRLLHRCGLEPVWNINSWQVTRFFARRAEFPVRLMLNEWFRPDSLPLPVRGPKGTDAGGIPAKRRKVAGYFRFGRKARRGTP